MRDIQIPRTQNTQKIQNYAQNLKPDMSGDSSYVNFQAQNKKSKKLMILGFTLSLALIFAIVFLSTFILDGATITVKPLKKNVQINETFLIEADKRASIVLVKNVNIDEAITLPKNSVKKVSKKAEGQIVVYNNNDTSSQKLIKGTRFSTVDGKVYRTQDSITVPGKTDKTPGSTSAKVIADSEGESYNIGKVKLNIPGFKGSAKFNNFYAEVKTDISGGSSGKSANVSDLDLEKGKSETIEKIKTKIYADLAKSVPDGFAYSKDTVYINYGSFVEVDQDKTVATYEMKATGTSLYIKRDELVKSIVEKTEKLSDTNATVEILDSTDFTISVVDSQDINDETKPVRIIITGTAPVIFKPSGIKISEYMAGKKKSEFTEITKKFQFVESATNAIRPFWASSFPKDASKIKVEIQN
jgi:hypothetical protein